MIGSGVEVCDDVSVSIELICCCVSSVSLGTSAESILNWLSDLLGVDADVFPLVAANCSFEEFHQH